MYSLGFAIDFSEVKDSCQELSAELAGDGMVSTLSDGCQVDLAENESRGLRGLGGLGGTILEEVKGSKG